MYAVQAADSIGASRLGEEPVSNFGGSDRKHIRFVFYVVLYDCQLMNKRYDYDSD